MSNDFLKYSSKAISLIRRNILICILPALFYAAFIHNPFVARNQGVFFLMSILLIFFPYPYVYGKIVEIIANCRKTSFLMLIKTHWINYLIASMVISAPALAIRLAGSEGAPAQTLAEEAGSLIIDVLTLYVFPLVFLRKDSIKSIILGIKCLLGNFTYSLPLVLIKTCQSIILSMVQRHIDDISGVAATIISSITGAVSIMVSVFLFIVAAMILKDHLMNLDDCCP